MKRPDVVDLHASSDAELIAAVRGGDSDAYGQLFERHRDAALRLARQIAGPSDADDLVSDAFVKVFRVLSAGGGPDIAFRAYLLTAVRRLHVDKIRRTSKVTPTDELESYDAGVPFTDPAVQEFENVAASKAFASLPERWQLVLWHLEVEGQKPAEVALLLGMSANSVSALAYRAREGLRQAYLQMHMADTAAEECRWVTERLGARVRNGLSRRDKVKVDEHLDQCARCSAIYLELSEVNSNLAGVLAPILLGAAATGYLASTGGAAGATGLAAAAARTREFVKTHGGLTAASTAAGVVAVAVAAAVVMHAGGAAPRDTASDGPRAVVPVTSSSTSSDTTEASSGPTVSSSTGPGSDKPSVGGPTQNFAPPFNPPFTPPLVLPPTTPGSQPTLTAPATSSPSETTSQSPPGSTSTAPPSTVPTTPTSSTTTAPTTEPPTTEPTSTEPTTSQPTTTTTTTSTTEPTTTPTTPTTPTTSTTTTTTTTTTTPPTATLAVGLTGHFIGDNPDGRAFMLVADVQTTGDPSPITLRVRADEGAILPLPATVRAGDWHCDGFPLAGWRCTTSNPTPGQITFIGTFFTADGQVSVTASAANAEDSSAVWPERESRLGTTRGND
ncbi:MAG TPA: sigma-70 family RNA polymerase sigma factor [Nocardioidaceae bacterium]|jgi:RNA polymerase sigma factor (sigma-70 family)